MPIVSDQQPLSEARVKELTSDFLEALIRQEQTFTWSLLKGLMTLIRPVKDWAPVQQVVDEFVLAERITCVRNEGLELEYKVKSNNFAILNVKLKAYWDDRSCSWVSSPKEGIIYLERRHAEREVSLILRRDQFLQLKVVEV